MIWFSLAVAIYAPSRRTPRAALIRSLLMSANRRVRPPLSSKPLRPAVSGLDAQAERVPDGVEQDAPLVRLRLDRGEHGADLDRLLLRLVEVGGVEVEVELLRSVLPRPLRRLVVVDLLEAEPVRRPAVRAERAELLGLPHRLPPGQPLVEGQERGGVRAVDRGAGVTADDGHGTSSPSKITGTSATLAAPSDSFRRPHIGPDQRRGFTQRRQWSSRWNPAALHVRRPVS